jgi:hypothetical protein
MIRFTLCAMVMLLPSVASAETQARFLGGNTYVASAKSCAMLKKLATGTPRNLGSVPQTLDAKGYHSWEGGCTIAKITPRLPGISWTVNLVCSEGATENQKVTETWTRNRTNSLIVAFKGRRQTYTVCEAGAKT